MDKKIAIRIMQFLDQVSTTGHQQRMEMNACVEQLIPYANAPDATGDTPPAGKEAADPSTNKG